MTENILMDIKIILLNKIGAVSYFPPRGNVMKFFFFVNLLSFLFKANIKRKKL